MKIQTVCGRLALALGIAGLASCGGGGGSSAAPATSGTSKAPAAQTVAVTFNIVIPPPVTPNSSRRPKYISPSTASATITINAGAPTVVACTTTCTVTVDAPIGLDTFAVSLKDGSNNLLSQGSMTQTISPTIANVVNISFGGQVKKITLSSTIANMVPGTLATVAPVTVTALDADNNTIIGSDPFVNPITLTDSDGSGATSLTTTSVTSPATVVNLTYSGSALLAGSSATITPSAAGTAGNTAVTFSVYAHHTILEYPIAGAGFLDAITAGSDGNIWFADSSVSRVGRITPAGVVSEFPTSGAVAYVALGSDGNVWFTEYFLNQIGRVTPAGAVSEFGGLTGTQPEGIAPGPVAGDLFFAEFGSASPGRVGKISTGGVVTESVQIPGNPQIQGVTAGSDGRVWITEAFPFPAVRFLDAMTTAFGLTQYAVPANAQLRDLTNGPDNNLWIVDGNNNVIDKVSTSGVFLNQFPIPGSGPQGMVSGIDGKLYFAEYTSNDIASMTTAGATATYSIPTGGAGADFVTSGPDGNIWFTEGSAGQIGRLIL